MMERSVASERFYAYPSMKTMTPRAHEATYRAERDLNPEVCRLHISYRGDQVRDLFERIATAKGMSLTQTFIWMVEDVTKHQSRRKQIISFSERTDGFWIEGDLNKVFLNVPLAIKNGATNSAFVLTGTGRMSKLFTTLVQFYAVHLGIINEPTKKPAVRKKSLPPISSAHDRRTRAMASARRSADKAGLEGEVRTNFTITATTNKQLDHIMMALRQKRMAVLRTMIEEIASSEDKKRKLARFFTGYTDHVRGDGRMLQARFNCSARVLGLLTSLSMEVIGTEQRSLMVRVLAAFYAKGIAAVN